MLLGPVLQKLLEKAPGPKGAPGRLDQVESWGWGPPITKVSVLSASSLTGVPEASSRRWWRGVGCDP